MLKSGKKIRALRDKKINILTLVLSEKKILNETKNHNPPPFKLNGRSLSGCCFTPFGVESTLVGVDVCIGLIWFDDTGLEIDVSDKTLNWFVVLKTMEKQTDV
jgi:hypothetical protein